MERVNDDTYSSGRTAITSVEVMNWLILVTHLLRNNVLARKRLGWGGRGRHEWWSRKGGIGAESMTPSEYHRYPLFLLAVMQGFGRSPFRVCFLL